MPIHPVLGVGHRVDAHRPMSVADLTHCNLIPMSRSDTRIPDSEFVSPDQEARPTNASGEELPQRAVGGVGLLPPSASPPRGSPDFRSNVRRVGPSNSPSSDSVGPLIPRIWLSVSTSTRGSNFDCDLCRRILTLALRKMSLTVGTSLKALDFEDSRPTPPRLLTILSYSRTGPFFPSRSISRARRVLQVSFAGEGCTTAPRARGDSNPNQHAENDRDEEGIADAERARRRHAPQIPGQQENSTKNRGVRNQINDSTDGLRRFQCRARGFRNIRTERIRPRAVPVSRVS